MACGCSLTLAIFTTRFGVCCFLTTPSVLDKEEEEEEAKRRLFLDEGVWVDLSLFRWILTTNGCAFLRLFTSCCSAGLVEEL